MNEIKTITKEIKGVQTFATNFQLIHMAQGDVYHSSISLVSLLNTAFMKWLFLSSLERKRTKPTLCSSGRYSLNLLNQNMD